MPPSRTRVRTRLEAEASPPGTEILVDGEAAAQGSMVLPVGIHAVEARLFGSLKDPESPVARILRQERISVLKPETGNSPKTFYVGLDKEVR